MTDIPSISRKVPNASAGTGADGSSDRYSYLPSWSLGASLAIIALVSATTGAIGPFPNYFFGVNTPHAKQANEYCGGVWLGRETFVSCGGLPQTRLRRQRILWCTNQSEVCQLFEKSARRKNYALWRRLLFARLICFENQLKLRFFSQPLTNHQTIHSSFACPLDRPRR